MTKYVSRIFVEKKKGVIINNTRKPVSFIFLNLPQTLQITNVL